MDYTEDELEEVAVLREEARLMGINIDLAIEDREPLAILRQKIEEAPADDFNYSYGL